MTIKGGQNPGSTPQNGEPQVNNWSSIVAEEDQVGESSQPVQRSQSTQSFVTIMSQNSVTSVASTTSEPSPCGRCRKLVKRGDNALQCEVCRQWFHIRCENITKQQYKLMQEMSQPKQGRGNAKLHWFCETCSCSTVDFMTGLAIQQGRIDAVERKVKEVENDVKSCRENVDVLEKRVTKIEENHENRTNTEEGQGELNQIIQKKLEEHRAEERERKERVNNIVMFNLTEPDDGTPQDKMNKDIEAFLELTKKVCKTEFKKAEIEKCFRLGKPENNKTRPVLIKLKDDEKKKKLFLNLSALREHKGKFENVKIGHDLTKCQRDEHKAMVEKAKQKDAEEGSENFIHLVRGPPDNLKLIRVPRKNQPK